MSLRDQLLAAGLVSQKQVREAERQQQHQERSQQQSKQKRRPHHQDPASRGPGHGPSASATAGHAAPAHAAAGNPQGAPAASAGSAAGAMTTNGAPGRTGATHSGQGHNGATHGGQGRNGASPGGTTPSAAVRQAAAQSAKVARDLALNKKQQEKAQQKARAAQIKQLIEQNRVARGQTDERYNFVDGGRVRFIAANAEIRSRLMAGELFIARHDGVYEVVPAAIAARIRERDERAVIDAGATAPAASEPVDDAYKDFAVPDDLMW